jgi:hypothetical protein
VIGSKNLSASNGSWSLSGVQSFKLLLALDLPIWGKGLKGIHKGNLMSNFILKVSAGGGFGELKSGNANGFGPANQDRKDLL